MKMAKPSQADIEAAGNLMSLLNDIDREYYPARAATENAPTFFDEDDPEHLRAYYDAVKATLAAAPGYQGRVIGGMCYVIMWDKNEIVDPESDTIDLHPKLVKALEASEASAQPTPSDSGSVDTAEFSEAIEEAAKLAPILRDLCEGGGEERHVDIYASSYQPSDGDVFVTRAADLLGEFAHIDSLIAARVATTQGMADCMHMVHEELIEAGIIDKNTAPMFIAEAVMRHVAGVRKDALEEAALLVETNDLNSAAFNATEIRALIHSPATSSKEAGGAA